MPNHIDAAAVIRFHDRQLSERDWPIMSHAAIAPGAWHWIDANHRYNGLLWREQGRARRPAAPCAGVAASQRLLERYDARRRAALRALDGAVLAMLGTPAGRMRQPDARPARDTPGAIVDRLSGLALALALALDVDRDRDSDSDLGLDFDLDLDRDRGLGLGLGRPRQHMPAQAQAQSQSQMKGPVPVQTPAWRAADSAGVASEDARAAAAAAAGDVDVDVDAAHGRAGATQLERLRARRHDLARHLDALLADMRAGLAYFTIDRGVGPPGAAGRQSDWLGRTGSLQQGDEAAAP